MKLLNHGEKLYQIKREIMANRFEKDGQHDLTLVKAFKEWVACDHVLKTQKGYLFVNEVEDAIVIDDELEEGGGVEGEEDAEIGDEEEVEGDDELEEGEEGVL